MTYKLNKTDGSQISLIDDFSIDTSTSLKIPGRGISNYASIIGDDLIGLLENFSSPVAPINPVEGQIWYRTVNPTSKDIDGSIYIFRNGSWVSASRAITSNIPPDINGDGTLWMMQPECMMWVYDSSIESPSPEFIRNDGTNLSGSWRLIGPQFSRESGSYVYEKKVLDTNKQYHSVIVTEVNGVTNSITSKDEFNLDTTVSGNLTDFTSLDENGNVISAKYAPIYSGVNLNNNIQGNQGYFNGMTTLAKNLYNFDISDVIGRGNNTTLRPTYPISDSVTDLGSESNKWNTIYSNNMNASSSIKKNGDEVSTEKWVNDTLSSDITLSNTTSFNTNGLVIFHRETTTPTDDAVEFTSDIGTVAKISADGSYNVIGGGHLYENNNRVILTDPVLSTESIISNIVSDSKNDYIRITDGSGIEWDIRDNTWVENNLISSQTDLVSDYKPGTSLTFDTTQKLPLFSYDNNTSKNYLATSDWASSTFATITSLNTEVTNRASADLTLESKKVNRSGDTIDGLLVVNGGVTSSNIVVSDTSLNKQMKEYISSDGSVEMDLNDLNGKNLSWFKISSTGVASTNKGTLAFVSDFDFTSNFDKDNGWQKLPSGLIIQWGHRTLTAGGGEYTLPMAFPNAFLFVQCTDVGDAIYSCGSAPSTLSTFRCWEGYPGGKNSINAQFSFMAIGY